MLVQIENLAKQFPGGAPPALAGVSAQIHEGQITGIVGPDGAGKTTLLRLLSGLLTPTGGRISMPGLKAHPREAIGYMPQRFGLYEDLTVQENLELHADLRGITGRERTTSFDRLLQFTQLHPFTKRLAGRLSGGMKQKLGLACALLGHPQLLLLDEPGVGVDPISRRELWNIVKNLCGQGIGVVWSTAYLEEAEACHQVLLLHAGRLLFAGPPAALRDRVKGRAVQVRGIKGSRRHFLARSVLRPEVMDGIIQGSNVRLLLRRDAQPPDAAALDAGPNVHIDPVPPRFEDAFIDLLGGGPSSESGLSSGKSQSLESHPQPGATPSPDRQDKSQQPSPAVVVEAKDLTKQFGDFTAADRITFQVRRGEVFGLLGPNGAGKSTTFRMLCGLLTPSSGQAQVMGIDLRRSPSKARQRLGYMAQKFSLYPHLSVRQNLEFFSGAYGLRGEPQRQAAHKMSELFKFEPVLNRNAGELPLGFKQRLALACALMHEPDLLFLDEPTSGVDPVTRREFWSHINALVEQGVTVVVTTHFMEEAEYCDRLALVSQGRIIARGTPEELKASAATAELPEPSLEEAFIQLVQRESPPTHGR
jgi:ABC-2 type transport system ATP-binding protein